MIEPDLTVKDKLIYLVQDFTSRLIAEEDLDISLCDLGLDSLDLVELMMDIEDSLNLDLGVATLDKNHWFVGMSIRDLIAKVGLVVTE